MGGRVGYRAGRTLGDYAVLRGRGSIRRARARRPRGALLALAGLAALLTIPVALTAATLATAGVTFTVTTTSDGIDANPGNGTCATISGACTLRAAVQETNALPGGDAIVLPAGTYELAIPPLNQNLADVGDLDITDSLTITGAGAGATVVDGGTPAAGAPVRVRGLDRIFELLADGGDIAFSGLTLSDGYAAEYGGAIMNNSTARVTVADSTLTGNVADKAGAAIDNHLGGTVQVLDSTLSNNVSFESGSALNNQRDGLLRIANSTVSSNSAADIGLDESVVGAGAIANNAELDARGTIEITESEVVDNAAGGSRSGAALSNDGAGTVTVDRTIFSKNRSALDGGAIFNGAGEVTVTGSTFSENAGDNGGAIFSGAKDGRLTVSGSTFSQNAAAAGGGALASGGTGHLTVSDSTFSKNTAQGWGGAIVNHDKGSVDIRRSTFTENAGLNGGGFGNEGDGLVTVQDSTFSRNSAVVTSVLASGEGGGLHSNSSGDVVVSGGVFSENKARSGGGLGNEGGGQLTITGTLFSANRADEKGGGILIQSGTVRMVDIDVVGNVAEAAVEAGGGIAYEGDKLVSVGEAAAIERSRIRDNKSKGQGGGIDSRGDGPLDILTTTISGNSAAMGGGIHHVGDAPLEITRSTLSGNFAESGGGVFTDGDGETTVENTTVSSNRAGQFGGGLLVSSRLLMRNGTVAANGAAVGGGINNGGGDFVGDGTVFLGNTIVASSPTGGNCAGTMTSRGGNLDSGNTCEFRELSDQPGTDPLLGPLSDNGGPTRTHALLAESPAQENAHCTDLDPCPALDQRGVERPLFDRVDAGAFESELTPAGGGGTQPCTGRSERPVPADYDSWVSEGTPASNFGSDSILKIKSLAGGNQRALVHFTLPVIPPGCNLVGATLRLFSSSAIEGRTLEALRIDSEWNETDVTWGSQPETAGSTATVHSGPGSREWNVLAQTQDMYTHGDYGFLIRDAAENESGEQSLHASEKGADSPPELVLVFDSPGAPPLGDECPTSSQSLFADRDSWVSQGSPSNNFGNDSTLKVKTQAGYNSRALVRFPLPTLPARCTGIAAATLRLEAASGTDGRMLETVRIASDWNELGVTWNNQPETSGPTVSAPSVDGPIEWGVTEHVVDLYLSGNHGFLIRDAEENGLGEEQALNGRLKLNDGPPELLLVFDASTPETTIESGPVSPTEETSATFTFVSDRADATFECSLDSAAFGACTSPHAVGGLALGKHTLEIRARRPMRAVDPSPARFEWSIVDLTPPVVTLTGPPAETEEMSATLEFSADEASTFACALDGVAVDDCASPLQLRGLALGMHTLRVDATDASANVGSATHEWTVVDVTAPTVTLTGPEAETEGRGAELTFSASEDATFACSLNGAARTSCESPQTLEDLALGDYVFEVTATDPSGNAGTATHAWRVVDLTAPVVTIAGPAEVTESRVAELVFTVSEEAELACSLNGNPVTDCASPLMLLDLALGDYVFQVRATDGAGNTGSAEHRWKVVDLTAPTVTLTGPSPTTEDTSATFEFSTSEEATTACSLDEVPLATCVSPLTRDGLALGRHTFEVSATDPSGNSGSATHAWAVVDVTDPVVSLVGPEAETEDRSATFTFSASEEATFACVLDGILLATCESPLTRSGLELGQHTLEVTATDPSGNSGSATHAWAVVDVTDPVVSLVGPDAETEETSATFTFSTDEPATLACTLDAVDVVDCESPLTRSGLARGDHRFEVAATDPSGNTGSAVHIWRIVDVTAPVVTLTGPDTETEETSATFTFSASEEATFACTLDAVAIADCASPRTVNGLGLGQHRFEVVATDASGNAGTAAHLWTLVDRTDPVVSLVGPDAETEETSATFTFSTDEPATLACTLDAVDVVDCESPLTRSGLARGDHRFEVAATDPSGNTGSAVHIWRIVDVTAPVVTLTGPDTETEETSATFTFSASEEATFACVLDGVGIVDCVSPLSRAGLAPGPHRFDIVATDAAGNSASVSLAWRIVDRTAPAITLDGPSAETDSPSATLTFSASESAVFTCSLDSTLPETCASPVELTDLALGAHAFEVTATDGSGNASSATHSWRVVPPPDTTAPVITLAGPDPETSDTSARLTFSADEAVTGSGARLTAPSPRTAPRRSISPGSRSARTGSGFEASDATGNVGTATH